MKKHKRRQLYLIIFCLIVFLIFQLTGSSFLSKLIHPFDYKEEVFFYSYKNNLDPFMVAAVIYVESKFEPAAVSPKGARGLMQIMPETAAWAAEKIGIDDYDDELLFEPHFNLIIGTWYLSALINQFNGNEVLALAAYNGGRNRVLRWIKEGIWDGEIASIDNIPIEETRNYVEKVLKTHERYSRIYDRNNY